MQPGEGKPAIPAFDTHALGLTICPWPSCRGDYVSRPLFASVAGRLFLFTDVLAEALGDPPPYDSKAPWSWTTIRARPPFFTGKVLCHALHPDGRILFVSALAEYIPMYSPFPFQPLLCPSLYYSDFGDGAKITQDDASIGCFTLG
ncbi:hypothetical protein C2845_PM09G08190 [Panicum miliaceum]|uniref:Uncharacterized protein n=1 Tax=Panicum miliaceum TaxID=4540 RepID=A0A3L6RY77_PANMI|nr:hypothetical protein C2845_PM09G08190 [Panicum miliaceum]